MKMDAAAHQFAAWLLRLAHRFSPPHAREWGDAMLAELAFVEGAWPALAWAAGGTLVLAREFLASLFAGPQGNTGRLSTPFSRKEVRMNKLPRWMSAFALAVFALLLFAPTFRNALDTTASGWRIMMHEPPMSRRTLDNLARQARAEHDPETLAFVALQLRDSDEGLRMAREAVSQDTNMTWIYDLFVWWHLDSQTGSELLRAVEVWDPDNAYPYLLEAQVRSVSNQFIYDRTGWERVARDPQWLAAMDKAVHALKFDSYYSRRVDLDRKVLGRRQIHAPFLALIDMASYGGAGFAGLDAYAKKLTQEGSEREAKGDLKGATEAYWTIARVGQTIERGAQADIDHFFAARLMREGYDHLRPLAEKSGDCELSTLLAFDSSRLKLFSPTFGDIVTVRALSTASSMSGWLAEAGLLLSGLLFLVAAICWAASRWVFRNQSLRLNYAVRTMVALGALALPVSSVVLYVAYKPLGEIYKHFLWGSMGAKTEHLFVLWSFGVFPVTLGDSYLFRELPWYFLLVIGACLLAFEAFRIATANRNRHVAASS